MTIPLTAAIVLVTARDESSASPQQQAAAAAVAGPAGGPSGGTGDDAETSVDRLPSTAGSEPGAPSTVDTRTSVSTSQPEATTSTGQDQADLETTRTGPDRERLETTTTGTVRPPTDLCDTTPPLTAAPSCPGYRTTTETSARTVVTGTMMITATSYSCGQIPGEITTTIPFCGGTPIPTVAPPPAVTTDVCSPSAVSTTHPSCAGDPRFCGAVTTIPTCPPRGSGG